MPATGWGSVLQTGAGHSGWRQWLLMAAVAVALLAGCSRPPRAESIRYEPETVGLLRARLDQLAAD